MLPPEYSTRPFWDIPKRQEQGDENLDTLYRAAGYCLTQWETLEVSLSYLFGVFVESRSPAATRVYGGLGSATSRAQALAQAAEVYFSFNHAWLASDFDKLRKAVEYGSPRRNDVAHGMAVSFAAIGHPGGGHYLIASTYNSRRNSLGIDFGAATGDPFTWSQTDYAYTSAQITDFGNRFKVMSGTIDNFIRKFRLPEPKPDQPFAE